jgi:hypothetical protein
LDLDRRYWPNPVIGEVGAAPLIRLFLTRLDSYKYQPFVEKRHEQLKNVFAVTSMWLYYVVELF